MEKIKLNKLQEELLKKSIVVWKEAREKIKNSRDFLRTYSGECCYTDRFLVTSYLSHGGKDCPLCREYKACVGCPIDMVSSGDCDNTPYTEWIEAKTKIEGIKAHDSMIKYMESILTKVGVKI